MFFLELSCFFDDPADVGNLISDSSVFSKTSLNIWKFMVHVLLKPGLENFEHYFTSMWDECKCVVSILWHCLSLRLQWKLTFCSSVATAEFSKFAGTASSFRTWNSSTGIPSHPLVLFIVMLPEAHLTKRGPLEKGMANHLSILAWRTPWRVAFWCKHKCWKHYVCFESSVNGQQSFTEFRRKDNLLLQRISYPEYNPEKIGDLLGAFGWSFYVVFA